MDNPIPMDDLDHQLRKQQLDQAMFPAAEAQPTMGEGFRGGTLGGARHLVSASQMRRERAKRAVQSPSDPVATVIHGSSEQGNATQRAPSASRPYRAFTVDPAQNVPGRNDNMYYRLSAMMSDREKQKSMANTRPMSVTEFFPSRGGGRSHGRMHQQAYGTFQYQQSHGNMPHQVSQGRFLHTPSVTKMPYGSHGMVPHSASLNHQHQPAQAQLQQHYQQAEGQPDASAFKDESQVPVMYAAWGFDHDGGAARPQINLPSDPPAPPSNRYTARMNPAVASADVSRDFGGGPGSRRVGTAPVGLRPSTGAGSISAARLGMPRMEEARRMESYSTSRGRSLGATDSSADNPSSCRPPVMAVAKTIVQVPTIPDQGRVPPREAKRDLNPFASVQGTPAKDSRERALRLHLPSAAAEFPGAVEAVQDLYSRLNSVRLDRAAEIQQAEVYKSSSSGATLLELLMSCQTPSNRRHAEIVDEWFQQRLQTLLPTAARFRSEAEAVEALTNLRGQEALSVIQDDKWVKLMQSCGIAMAALVQQAAVHCHERGDAMSQVWSIYTVLHDLKVQHLGSRLADAERHHMSASKEAKEMISNQADLKEIMSENEKLLLENKEMKVRIPVIESERDDYMRRMVELEEALALSELRGLNLQRLKNFTLKKFVDVATEKVASRTREVDLLSQTLRKIRFEHEALARNQARVMSALSDASKMTEMLPSHNQIRAAVVSAAESSDDLHGILQRLEKLDEDASNILEVAEDANSAAGSASYDGESLYELMKATVEMFQLDVDVESLHTTLRPASRQGSSSNNGLGNGDENSAEVGVSMSSQPSGYTGDGSSADGRGANRASKAPAMRATSMGVATNISGTDRGCDRSQQPGGSNSDRADVMDDDLPGGGTGALPDASYFGGQ